MKVLELFSGIAGMHLALKGTVEILLSLFENYYTVNLLFREWNRCESYNGRRCQHSWKFSV